MTLEELEKIKIEAKMDAFIALADSWGNPKYSGRKGLVEVIEELMNEHIDNIKDEATRAFFKLKYSDIIQEIKDRKAKQ